MTGEQKMIVWIIAMLLVTFLATIGAVQVYWTVRPIGVACVEDCGNKLINQKDLLSACVVACSAGAAKP